MTDIAKISNKALGEEIERRIVAGGGKLTLIEFGSFKRVQVPARTARNPRTGEPVPVHAHETTRFKPSKA